MNFYQLIIPRLNGNDIEKDFARYRKLVEKGIAGFIIFGGELKTVKQGIKELQKIAKTPLIIASDLEQGLGQQIKGGTLFPPAMAIASAITPPSPPLTKGGIAGGWSSKLKLLRNAFKAIALEARHGGINTIFAPVLDINTNPKNPIISTRAFGEDARTVSFFGCEMIRALQANMIAACGKHFPGHGDTSIDSHIGLPLVKKSLRSLEKTEIAPFREAVTAGVQMIMLGHLKAPALDPSGLPMSLSEEAVKYLRNKMKFKGILITDALNMAGIGKFSEERAALIALRAGVDLLLHPTEPERLVSYLEKNYKSEPTNVLEFRRKFCASSFLLPASQFEKHRRLSEELAKKAIKITGRITPLKRPLLVILNDEACFKGDAFVKGLRRRYRTLRYSSFKTGEDIRFDRIADDSDTIVAVFSGIRAWKGGPSPWLLKSIKKLESRADIFISFGSPYLLDGISDDITKIYAYWDSDSAQEATAEVS